MKSGVYIANYALQGKPDRFVKLAQAAEDAGWDGFFIWDHIYPDDGEDKTVADPWILLAAIATSTDSIKLGPTVTPLPRRRPRKVARETASLDILSGGRLIFGVGLGHPPDYEFEYFGEDPSTKVRAEKLDEGLDILEGLWSGKPFSYDGKHYKIIEVTFKPRPVQKPRIPIWVASWFSRKGPLKRAARYDGVFPIGHGERLTPDDYREICEVVREHRTSNRPFDVVLMGRSKGDSKNDQWVQEYVDAGANWYLELVMSQRLDKAKKRIRKGPPIVD